MKLFFLVITILSVCNLSAQENDDTDKKEKSSLDLPGYLKLNFSLTTLSDSDPSMKTNLFPSRSFDLYYSKPLFLGENFSFNPGLGLSVDKMSFKNDIIPINIIDNDGLDQTIIDTLSFVPDKNSLKGNYLILPIDLKYYFGSGKYDKGRFFLGFGAEVGLMISSSTKVKNEINNVMTHTKIKNDFGLNQLKYAISLQVGSGNFNLYYKMHLSSLFGDSTVPLNVSKNPYINKFGISFSIF